MESDTFSGGFMVELVWLSRGIFKVENMVHRITRQSPY